MERPEIARRVFFGVIAGAVCAAGILLLLRPRPLPVLRHMPKPAAVLITPAGPLAGVTVVLDPGHGGEDSGAVCGSLFESALTYRTATEVAASLRGQGATVVYTVRSRQLDPALASLEPLPARPSDAVLSATNQPLRLRRSPEPLWLRAATARTIWNQRSRQDPDAGRDVFFLSLHYDESPAAGISGSIVCVDRRVSQVPAFARVLAREMMVGNFGRGTDFRGIRGLSGRKLGVLNPDYNPVLEKALLEMATLSNPQDALQASDPAWREEIARRITDAVIIVHQQPLKKNL